MIVESRDNDLPWGSLEAAFVSSFWACVVLIIRSRLLKKIDNISVNHLHRLKPLIENSIFTNFKCLKFTIF